VGGNLRESFQGEHGDGHKDDSQQQPHKQYTSNTKAVFRRGSSMQGTQEQGQQTCFLMVFCDSVVYALRFPSATRY